MLPHLVFFFFKQLRAYVAEGALVIFRQLLALVNIATYCADELFHAVSSLLIH